MSASAPSPRHHRGRSRGIAVSLAISIALHLVILAVVAVYAAAAELAKPEQEIEVPITFADPPPPAPLVEATPIPAPETAPTPEREPEPERPSPRDDQSLLGFRSSEGEIEARPTRPQGPEADLKAPPKPEEAETGRPEPEPVEEPVERERETRQAEEALEEDSPDGETLPTPKRPSELPGARIDDAKPRPEAPRSQERRTPFPPPPREPSSPSARTQSPRRAPDLDFDTNGGLWADNIKFESADYDWSDYSTKLYFAVYRAWLRELLGRVRRFERDQAERQLAVLEGEVSIRFVIQEDGSVRGLEIIDESVIPTLDEASSAAIERAVIPPLPADFPRRQERVSFRFRISGFEAATTLERQLKFAQMRGEF